MARPSVITVGTFDGVHAGHAELARRCRAHADRMGGEALALVFDPHPLAMLRPGAEPARLSTLEQRVGWLRELGMDRVIRLDPASGVLDLDARAFVQRTVEEHGVGVWVEGPDFRFGKGRAGDAALLGGLGAELGFEVEIAPPWGVALDNHQIARASSTLVRTLLGAGRVRDAARVLERAYEIRGTVVRGDRRGRTIGYPTANIDAPHLLPADGVYAGTATATHDGRTRTYLAAISVGTKPTFGKSARTAEAFFLDASAEPGSPALGGLPEYGWSIGLAFQWWVREQLRFSGLEPLLEQMARDCERCRTLLQGAAAHA